MCALGCTCMRACDDPPEARTRVTPEDTACDVLVVEDNADDAEFTVRVLRKSVPGLRIAVAGDGLAALDFLLHRRSAAGRPAAGLPRAVLLDLKLPKLSGLEVLRRLKSDPATRALPVVVLTSSREPRDIHEAYLRGANGYVVKPVQYAELVVKLDDLARYWLGWNRTA
jgi:two-component system, response regulator